MLTDREIISTLEMLENEHLDVRTVTLGINLLDCAGDDLARVKNKIQAKIFGLAASLIAAVSIAVWFDREAPADPHQ